MQHRVHFTASALAWALACAGSLGTVTPAGAAQSNAAQVMYRRPMQPSLYAGPAPRPGPDILYAPLAEAPQFRNTGIWKAPPILVSGASSYRDGEYLYQDYIYDDGGAKEVPDPTYQPKSPDYIDDPVGTYTYPSAPQYANNAADIVEVRLKSLSNATAFRITFNTMYDASLVAFTIGLGSSATSYAMPHGANTTDTAQIFVTVNGTSADAVNAATGTLLGATAPRPSSAPKTYVRMPTPEVNTANRQIEVTVPHALLNPSRSRAFAVSLAAGLWNRALGTYLVPSTTRTSTTPGGGGTASAPSAFFNVAFRHNESFESLSNPATTYGWRDGNQAAALASGDISSFHDTIDMVKLASGANDDMPNLAQGVPQTGILNRIYASHFEPQQGVLFGNCDGLLSICAPEYLGHLQPYSLYVPAKTPPSTGYGLTLMLHALTGTYNQFANTDWQANLANRGTGSIVLSPEARGPDAWYYGLSGVDPFEAWADVAAHYQLDPEYTAIDGYSMGGYASYKLAAEFPDLFARGHATVGTPGAAEPGMDGVTTGTGLLESSQIPRVVPSLRNVPYLMFYAGQDELIPPPDSRMMIPAFDNLGYRYEWDLFNPAEHLTIFTDDIFGQDATFLGDANVDPNPPHVTYAVNPVWDYPQYGFAGNHAYWVSGVTLLQKSGTAPLGTFDVRSEGFGVGDPAVSALTPTYGVDSAAYTSYEGVSRTWSTPPRMPVVNKLDIAASNIATATIDPSRAHVNCHAQIGMATDSPIKLTLTGCWTRSYSANAAPPASGIGSRLPANAMRSGRTLLR